MWLAGFILTFGGMTFVFPLLAVCLSAFTFPFRKKSNGALGSNHLHLEVLIPAYNEADTIAATLASVFKAREKLLAADSAAQIKITVALDGSKDDTGKIVKGFISTHPELSLLDRGFNLGKWKTLEELSLKSQAPWSALVDAGTVWPEHLLIEISKLAAHADDGTIGFAPGYHQDAAGKLERLVWWLERTLKGLENLAGGPVSLHGATMILKTSALKNTFKKLGDRSWLNDDVVLGISLRAEGRIQYLSSRVSVSDCGIREGTSEINRRRRLMNGNVEWIRELFPNVILHSPVVGVIALRRIFRFFWAYNLVISLVCLNFFLGFPALLALIGVMLLTFVFYQNRRLREAAAVALTGPLLVFGKQRATFWS